MKKAAAVNKKKVVVAEKEPVLPKDGPKPIRYVRLVELPLAPGDAYQGYQPEIIHVLGDTIVERTMISKPNLFEFAWSQAGEYIDPRNVLPTEEQ